ncbi:EF-P lysine aminoacylase EpmA [Planctomicrobium sp. SH668]|uniref:EF-P lysine aminoacylase EpmA n=1 Tax=Planctomicrobium sp. SH668 TaxID=3448126 RepID=UPI003F5C9014
MSLPPSYRPTASIKNLQRRAILLRGVREYFESQEFWEVETPILSHDCCIDQWLDPFSVQVGRNDVTYMQTSPEFAMKRLLCAGADRIYEITKVFRQDEVGERHNPEFTMIEWYQLGVDHHDQMSFVEGLIRALNDLTIVHRWKTDHEYNLFPFQRLTFEEAFLRFVGFSPQISSTEQIAIEAARLVSSLPHGIDEDRDGLLNLILAEVVEPGLKSLKAVFLYDFPETQAALAKVRSESGGVAERFELYLNGVELCNGYHELTDPVELRLRMERQNAARVANGKPSIPVQSQLLDAMDVGMPECSGVALGFDRLVMWCLGTTDIRDVIAFPFDRA